MQATSLEKSYEMISEDEFNKVVLESIKENKEGVKEYPILSFDERALNRLCQGIEETMKHSKVKPAGGKAYEFIKRTADIILSLIALVILTIPLCILALVIFIEDRGNPFFSQVRLTKGGKPFKMYKLRSMCTDADEKFAEVQKKNKSDGVAFKDEDDPRITKVGKFIRRTSLDELPQFWNVLKGDMSIIGPRPPLPREVVLYTPAQMDRLLVKGGLSCICQTEGRSDMPFEEWVESDIEYIKKRSLGFDLKLMIKTVAAVICGRGAK